VEDSKFEKIIIFEMNKGCARTLLDGCSSLLPCPKQLAQYNTVLHFYTSSTASAAVSSHTVRIKEHFTKMIYKSDLLKCETCDFASARKDIIKSHKGNFS
jgi:hypothetical protein